MIVTTARLALREMTWADRPAIAAILQDEETMWAYEGAFSEEEVDQWLENQLRRYREDGFGLWAVELRSTGEVIGQCGLTWQRWGEKKVLEVGYLFRRDQWHNGYAAEAAIGCREYAFTELGFAEVYSIIRDMNGASKRVAIRNGMVPVGGFVKHYRGVEMPHTVYRIARQ